ncbi:MULTISPECIES: efflux RND transporter periplasmic adaptor subunit [unclassified Beijerinckia]|uniref:efflux RND transporter periplasmic adaptor subunit n=1 Tax=unclassified Beijerinckia TaxID=2638183 RepID=UPI001114D3C0|nr:MULTISPECIES: efflux RND transporter periplasmic adaptor subunit [unclassified Beijerinckia]
MRSLPVVAGVLAIGAGLAWALPSQTASKAETATTLPKPAAPSSSFKLSEDQMAAVTLEPATEMRFRSTLTTDGKIAVNEDEATPVYPAYAGRTVRILAKPGDQVQRGQVLFTLEAADMVQAQTDFISAVATLNKAISQENLAKTAEKRVHGLYLVHALAQKDWQEAQAELVSAQNDTRSGQVAVEAASNRLRLLGRSDEEIDRFKNEGRISAETSTYAPLSGTVVQRKIGPGQFIAAGSSDPAFVIGDLSSVWIVANVRESDAGNIRLGQTITVSLLAYPGQHFNATVDYVSSSVDPSTRRLQVRGTIANPDRKLRPEMFATATIDIANATSSIGVPRHALVYEGDSIRLWVYQDGKITPRNVTTGLINDDFVEIKDGLRRGETVVTRGSLFIDRANVANAG